MKNLKRQFTFIGSFIALTFFVWVAPVQAVDPDLIDVVEIIGTNPFIVHTNILPGDAFTDIMTVNNLTGTSQDIVMGLDIDLSEGIVPWPPFELEEKITVKIEKVGSGFLILPGPGGDTIATLQELDDTVIGLGAIAGSSGQVYKIYATFDLNAGNEYQNTKVYFNITMSVDIPDLQGSLLIAKTTDSVAPEAPGNEVGYTLRVTAIHGGVNDVVLTDLPPEGFAYVFGSGTGAPFIHQYASPGVWDLGDLGEDETVTVTYKTKISGNQDDGLYRDIAFATGTNGSGAPVIAVDQSDADNFVGTEVAVVTPTSESVQLKEKDKTDTTTKRIIKRVLGASILPATGAQISWVILALVLFVSGLGMMMYAKRKKALAMKNSNKIITKIVFLFVLGTSVLALPSQASATTVDPRISVRIEAPESPSMESAFAIGFVTLDIGGRDLSAQCYQTGDVPVTTAYVHNNGGNSGNCLIDLPDGTYQFYVRASYEDEEDTVFENVSETVTVEIKAGTPGTPLNYNREKNSCGVSFTTANDGLTTKVELYRSTENSFVADASTFATTLAIAPNTNGAMIDPGADCKDYFYAIRAVSVSGAGSGFVGDDDVTVKHKTNTKTVTETVAGGVGGAIPVTGGGAVAGGETTVPTAGSVEGAETENVSGENGSVLGEGTIAGDVSSWISSHPWWSALIALVLLALGYRGYQVYQKKRNEQSLQ
ncbi:MAG: hypothetical protein AUK19_00520 [Candidatus Moranbacteria bacterium CG2_30_45_14]|nr:MAG: hypothetical protein AUK19_00520 [Candidatus Moranbacteria bacterium CG2_30_45_14]